MCVCILFLFFLLLLSILEGRGVAAAGLGCAGAAILPSSSFFFRTPKKMYVYLYETGPSARSRGIDG